MTADRFEGSDEVTARGISDRELLDFAHGRLSAAARVELERRLDASPADSELVAELARIYGDQTQPSGDEHLTATGSAAVPEGSRMGRYLVIGEIGRGGMGVVLRAYDPRLHREVALKCLRPGSISSETQARLAREAQAMAKLSHPNVVGVYDVDVLEDQLVLAMEYVDGVDLDAWRKRRRTWSEVVEVFMHAGRGLAAAHAAGLLHRDFKPANVLISAKREVKVTDFGIAHDDDPRGQLRTPQGVPTSVDDEEGLFSDDDPLTEDGEVVGTPAFMPPEQFKGAVVTAAADQYAFCASLWQALTGQLPFDVPGAGPRGITQLIRLKLEGPPRWPSSAPAVPRRTVDAITRGLAVDPGARWPSMTALLDELSARPVRPRRGLVAGLAAVAAVAGGLGWYAYDRARTIDACEQEGRAIEDTWSAARADAVAAAFGGLDLPYAADTWARAQPRVDAFARAWGQARTQVCMEGEVEGSRSARLLAMSRSCLEEQRVGLQRLAEQWSEPDANVAERAGGAAWSLPSVRSCTDEVELARRGESPEDPREWAATQALREQIADARALLQAGRPEDARARAQEILDRIAESSRPRLLAATRRVIGDALIAEGRYEESVQVLETAYAEAFVAEDDDGAMRAAEALSFVHAANLARPEPARRWSWLAELSLRRLELPDDHPRRAVWLSDRGVIRMAEGNYEQAIEDHQRALRLREARLGSDHPELATVLGNLGSAYAAMGDFAQAQQAQERALEIREAALGPDHPDVALLLNNLGNAYVARGQLRRGLAVHQRALSIREATLAPDHPHLAGSLGNIGTVYNELGEYDRALAAHQRALGILEATLGPEHPDVASTLGNVGHAYRALGRWEEARTAAERALAIVEGSLGVEHPDYGRALSSLGLVLDRLGEHEAALQTQRRALGVLSAALGSDNPLVALVRLNIADVLHAQGEHAQALAGAEQALAGMEPAFGAEHPYVGTARLRVGTELLDLGRAAAAVVPLEQAVGILAGAEAASSSLGEARFALARARWALGDDRPAAVGLARRALEELGAQGSGDAATLAEVRAWVVRRREELRPGPDAAEPAHDRGAGTSGASSSG
ncbi:MAG: serine/threonine-protein kinase [Nannocystaceae bacterium]